MLSNNSTCLKLRMSCLPCSHHNRSRSTSQIGRCSQERYPIFQSPLRSTFLASAQRPSFLDMNGGSQQCIRTRSHLYLLFHHEYLCTPRNSHSITCNSPPRLWSLSEILFCISLLHSQGIDCPSRFAVFICGVIVSLAS